MFRLGSYLIVRAFTSIAIGMAFMSYANGPYAQMPDIRFEDARGKAATLADFAGKPIVINLWASWCAPCIQEMPSLALLQEKFREKGLVVLALSEDTSKNKPAILFNNKGIKSLRLLFDKNHQAWNALRAPGLPLSVIIDKSGHITRRTEGPVNWQAPEIEDEFNRLTR